MSKEFDHAARLRLISNLLLKFEPTIEGGYVVMPVRKMKDQVLYLENVVLPQAKSKLGEESDSYKFYKGLVDTMLYCLLGTEKTEYLSHTIHHLKTENDILRERLLRTEKELQQYRFVEDQLVSSGDWEAKQAAVKQAYENQKEAITNPGL